MKNNNTPQKTKWITVVTYALFIVGLLLYSALMLKLFHRQTVSDDITFKSDMAAYLLEMQGLDSGFDFPYPIFFWLGRFFMLFTSVEWAGALATMTLNSLSVVILAYYMQKTLKEAYSTSKYEQYFGILTVAVSFSVFFASMLFAPQGVYLPGMDHKYLGVFTPNPFHNATYMASRPFTIVAFFLFVRILDYYERKIDWKEFTLFGLFMLLTTMTKPSYTLIMVSTAGLIMAYRIIKAFIRLCGVKHFNAGNREGTINTEGAISTEATANTENSAASTTTIIAAKTAIRNGFILGAFFIPTFIDLLYQFGGVFGTGGHAGTEGGIGIGFAAVWKVHMSNIPLAIVLALAFPGLMLVCNLKQLKGNTLYRFSWQLLLVSLAEVLLLFEKGDRFVHMNFAWGYMHGIFFVFITSLILLIQNTVMHRQKWYLLTVQWLAYGWHLLCGYYYFQYIWSGQFFYCF